MRVVVIGGLGNFGARICRRLACDSRFNVIATSRRAAVAGRVESLQGIEVAVLDTNSVRFAQELRSLAPDFVVHCAGPFQGQDYRVALASLACGAHYADLADGREFVAGFVAAVGTAAAAAGGSPSRARALCRLCHPRWSIRSRRVSRCWIRSTS
jgi:saccharopine dehydrogenase-like NADP-dependent oxidoreductase